ncbi:sigma-70 family RNA polymerase sigma factor [Planctomycetales bacterium ZRK34]|nr:sigma-70 family RNA polymerase sigma factor [Planctomycetales bacterium ZRK34]
MQNQLNKQFIAALTGNQRRLFAFIFSLVPDPVEAEEILQQTNLKIWERADQYDLSREFMPWASQIAYYEILYHQRHTRRAGSPFDAKLIEQLAGEAAAPMQSDEARLQALEHCIRGLPPNHRQLIEQRYGGNLSVKQLAQQRGATPGGLSQLLFRIRAALLTCIQRRLTAEADV